MPPKIAMWPPTRPATDATPAGNTSLGVSCSRLGLLGSVLMSSCFLHDVMAIAAIPINIKLIFRFIYTQIFLIKIDSKGGAIGFGGWGGTLFAELTQQVIAQ